MTSSKAAGEGHVNTEPVSSEAAGRCHRPGYSLSRLHGGASKRGEAEAEQLFERRRLFHLSAASPAARRTEA